MFVERTYWAKIQQRVKLFTLSKSDGGIFFQFLILHYFLYLGQIRDRSTHQVDHQCIIIELLSTAKNISRGLNFILKLMKTY